MGVPINTDFGIGNIHRHNGRADDDCEVTLGGETTTMRPDKVAAFVAAWLKDVLPAAIKQQTGFDVAAVSGEVV